jgi:hypothetical protein
MVIPMPSITTIIANKSQNSKKCQEMSGFWRGFTWIYCFCNNPQKLFKCVFNFILALGGLNKNIL